MSNEDSFINEVNDEVREDQLFQTFRKYGWVAALVVVALVGGAAWSEFSKSRTENQAKALGDAVLDALETEEPVDAVAALETIDATGNAAAVTALLRAAELQRADAAADAADVLDSVSLDGDVDPIYRDLATFKALLLRADTLDASERRAGFHALSQPGNPYRLMSVEQIALLDVEADDLEAALRGFAAILEDAEATTGLRRRARGMIVALGADPDELVSDAFVEDTAATNE
ncbi:hypothetical protein [Thalassobium sp. R2A62]|uniref:hypothetical protein n=1 Tax=Thalassobium sp. R2A62 TaxID=633131 RepID=UPI0001B1D007|nr:hypothetical protein [Thalassobium sp. R2A62]EET46730.1 hypothetical protein TR2A62_0362 [Thalassobium sp. R2A62]